MESSKKKLFSRLKTTRFSRFSLRIFVNSQQAMEDSIGSLLVALHIYEGLLFGMVRLLHKLLRLNIFYNAALHIYEGLLLNSSIH